MKKQITKSEYGKEWKGAKGTIHYHNLWLEGDDKPWNIGAKEKNPSFLQPGQILNYEITDESKRKIKRVQESTGAYGNKKPINRTAAPPDDPDSPVLIRMLGGIKESDLIFFDIETARATKDFPTGTPLEEAWLYKARYNNEVDKKTGESITPEQYYLDKSALYAPFARIVSIVAGRIDGDQLRLKTYKCKSHDEEGKMLHEFNEDIKSLLNASPDAMFCGWANKGFDEPFLMKRMLVHGIKPNLRLDTVHQKPWEIKTLDLKDIWMGSSYYPDSLIAVATALGLPSPKSNMDGSMVGEAYWSGKLDEIVEYNKLDVLTVANVWRKFVGGKVVTL